MGKLVTVTIACPALFNPNVFAAVDKIGGETVACVANIFKDCIACQLIVKRLSSASGRSSSSKAKSK